MKTISYKVLFLTIFAVIITGCYKEKTPEAIWKYPGVDPEITDGPSNAQKLCYELYQKYGLHIYYNLTGVERGTGYSGTIRTDVGWLQTNGIATSDDRPRRPILPADEASGERFLTLLKGFFSVLPDNKVPYLGIHRRYVLAKINPEPGNGYHATLRDEDDNPIYSCSYTEEQQGVIIYGYLLNHEDTDNTLFSNVEAWKWNICYRYFLGSVYTFYKRDFVMPPAFILASAGLYNQTTGENAFNVGGIYNHEVGKRCGFVHPFGGVNSTAINQNPDWASYVAWILTTPYAKRSVDIAANPRIQIKYSIVLDYYKTTHNIDLEASSVKYCALTP